MQRSGDPLLVPERPSPSTCTVENCDRRVNARGYCDAHYRKWREYGNPLHVHSCYATKVCTIDSCDRRVNAKGLCHNHYRKWREYGNPLHVHSRYQPRFCSVDGCDRKHEANGYCSMHSTRLRVHGDPLTVKLAPKGSGHVNGDGYRVVCRRGHPNVMNRNGLILEHRWVMAEYLGRPLYRDEVVHHRNGERADNRIENLELWVHSHPRGQRPEDIVAWAKEMLERYEEVVAVAS